MMAIVFTRIARMRLLRVEGQLGRRDVVAALAVRQEGLGAVAGPLDRPAQLLRGERGHRVLGIEHRLHAEAAADIGRDHPDLFGREAEIGGERVAERPGSLGAGMDGELALAPFQLGHGRPRLHRVADEAVVDQLELGDVRGLGEGRVHRAGVAIVPVIGDVVGALGMDLRLAGLEGGRGVGDRVQGLVVDLDQLGRVAGLGPGLGDHEGHVVADIAGLVGDQDRVLGHRRLRRRRGSPSARSREWSCCRPPRGRRAVSTASTPGAALAAAVSTPLTFACAWGERTTTR